MDLKSLNDCIDEVAEKYNYSSELVEALKRCVPEMIERKSEEDIGLLIETLKRVQIFTFESIPTQQQIDDICNQKLNGRNTHIKIIEDDLGEYNKLPTPGAYVSQPVFDDEMNITDRMGFIYLTNLDDYNSTKEAYGTNINLSHLIHELGYAWASQKGEYVQEERGHYTHCVGAMRTKYNIDRVGKTVEEQETQGLYLEEALNTIEEENSLYRILGVERWRDIPGYVNSNYQGCMSDLMRHYIEKLGYDRFSEMRLQKNNEKIRQLQGYFDETDFMKHINDADYEKHKRECFKSYENTDMSAKSKDALKTFFEKYEELYFPKIRQQDYIKHLDRVMEQIFNFMTIKLRFDITNSEQKTAYSNILVEILREGYVPVNQASEIIRTRKGQGSITIQELTSQALVAKPTRSEIEQVDKVDSQMQIESNDKKGETSIDEPSV